MEQRDTTTSNCRHEALYKLSDGKLAVSQESSQGSYVIANAPLQPGHVILECPSASIALDPPFRHTHCGFCAQEIVSPSAVPCPKCCLIATCSVCQGKGALEWHNKSGECQLLQILVESFGKVFTEFQGMAINEVALQEPIYVITIRLIHRKRLQEQKSSSIPCPFPDIDWRLLDLLYSSPLPSECQSLLTAMATLVQVMNLALRNQSLFLNPQDCLKIWNQCRGCCHAITDLSRPLGEQALGIALFVPHSFYNHSCAPNAFLSCLPPTNINPQQCAVTARVACCSTIQKGEPILLSYIPLSGLCTRERQMRLKESYHFECQCALCKDADKKGSTAYELEQAVGGDFASSDEELKQILGPLRELQIDCHQQLTRAASSVSNSKKSQEQQPTANANEEEATTDCIEQCIATLQMAQRGIQNNKIPASNEVSLECHRLLAVAHFLLQKRDQEKQHLEAFVQAACEAQPLMDPPQLALQHSLLAQCLVVREQAEKGAENKEELSKQREHHLGEAIRIATTTLGEDHPFVASLKLPSTGESDANPNKKRKLDD